MRVTCGTVDEFVANLESLKPEELYRRTVWVAVDKRVTVGTRHEPHAEEVAMWAGCVVTDENGEGYLLEVGVDCGVDRLTGGGDLGGSDRAEELKGVVRVFSEKRGWAVRCGRLSDN